MNKVQYDLGIITDIDLRGDVGATSSSFGIKHKLYAIGNYYDVFKDDGNVGMCAVFKGLADVQNILYTCIVHMVWIVQV